MRSRAKLFVPALLLILLILALPAPIARATGLATTASAVTTDVTIRVRSGPGTAFPQISLLLAGTTVPLKGRSGDSAWLEVENIPGSLGWVAGWLVSPNGDLNGVPIQAAAPAPAGGVATATTVVAANLRPEPDTAKPPLAV